MGESGRYLSRRAFERGSECKEQNRSTEHCVGHRRFRNDAGFCGSADVYLEGDCVPRELLTSVAAGEHIYNCGVHSCGKNLLELLSTVDSLRRCTEQVKKTAEVHTPSDEQSQPITEAASS